MDMYEKYTEAKPNKKGPKRRGCRTPSMARYIVLDIRMKNKKRKVRKHLRASMKKGLKLMGVSNILDLKGRDYSYDQQAQTWLLTHKNS